MTFDFSIEYNKGVDNKVSDALYRMPTSKLLAISLNINDPLYDKIEYSWSTGVSLQLLITKL